MTNRDFALLAAKTLSDKKAQDIVIIDIQETYSTYHVSRDRQIIEPEEKYKT